MKKSLAPLMITGLLALAACGSDGMDDGASGDTGGSSGDSQEKESDGGNATEVIISAFQYKPNPLEIEVGTTVIFTNDDNIDHTVTSGKQRDGGVPGVDKSTKTKPDGVFDGELPKKGDTFEFTFDEAGEFPYFCEIHAGMTGTVIVR